MCHPAGVSLVAHRDLAVQNRRWLLLLLQARFDGSRNLHAAADRGVREAAASGGGGSGGGGARRCVCSPTRHPGSFRCRQHHADQYVWGGRTVTRRNYYRDPVAVAD